MRFSDTRYPEVSTGKTTSPGERRIYGYVRSRRDSTALLAAHVQVVGTTFSALSDEEGRFALFVPETVQGELRIELIGFRTELIPIPVGLESSRIDVEMGDCPICIFP